MPVVLVSTHVIGRLLELPVAPFEEMLVKLANLVCALPLAIVGAFAIADDVYRSVMPDGQVIYGDTPQPEAREVRKVPPPQASGVSVTTERERAKFSPRPLIDLPPGGVVVIPQQPRPSPEPAQTGKTYVDPEKLPQRAY
jgi:hypothetical protein